MKEENTNRNESAEKVEGSLQPKHQYTDHPIYQLRLKEFDYNLPEEKIAQYPLQERDEAKMLVYREGEIAHSHFKNLDEWLPSNSLMVFNDTKVFHARLIFQKETGAEIEVFCLEPAQKHREVNLVMWDKGESTWQCMVRNLKKWPEDEFISMSKHVDKKKVTLKAKLESKGGERNTVHFEWKPKAYSFATILDIFGEVPLPPYIDREPEKQDDEAYQTVFAQRAGAVAAPTAGLHFTEQLLQRIQEKGVDDDYITLHVGAGTFKPVETDRIPDHAIHSEQVLVRWENLQNLKHANGPIIPVGTTSLRALESIYWFGVKLLSHKGGREFFIPKLMPYEYKTDELPSVKDSLDAIISEMEERGAHQIAGNTEIFILPSYEFKMADALITNYHMPRSTLIMLIAAFIGEDWKTLYKEALENDYRFLSYGDGSLLFPKKEV